MSRVWSLLGRLRHDRRGSVAVMLAGGLVLFVGLGAAVVDIGYLFHVRRVLQTSADMAALAGAQDINCCSSAPGQAISTAVSYSGVSGNRNAADGLDINIPSGYPVLRCLSSTGISCTGSDSANAIVVRQQTNVPLFFARIFGTSTLPISVTSVAGKGGVTKPADVMVILDTTASMNTVDASCSISGATRLDCAFAGLRTLLAGFSPTQNRVGLMVFPGLTSSGAADQEYDCSPTTPASGSIAPGCSRGIQVRSVRPAFRSAATSRRSTRAARGNRPTRCAVRSARARGRTACAAPAARTDARHAGLPTRHARMRRSRRACRRRALSPPACTARRSTESATRAPSRL